MPKDNHTTHVNTQDAELAGALAYLRAMEAEGMPAAAACSVIDASRPMDWQTCNPQDDGTSAHEWRYPNLY